MEILIRITLQYVGADVPTEFAKKYVHKIRETVNPHLPLCVMYDVGLMGEKSLRYITFLRYGYFSPENVFCWKSVPLQFVERNMTENPVGSNACPHLSQDFLYWAVQSSATKEEASIILRNPAIFSGSIEVAEKIATTVLERHIHIPEDVAIYLSQNEGASLQFFIRNPQYINWPDLILNEGEVFRGDEKKVVSFLESEKKRWTGYEWGFVDTNRAIPISFLLSNVENYKPDSLKHNPDIPASFWSGRLETKRPQVDLIEHPHVSFSHICSRMEDCHPSMRTYMLQSAYNIPIDGVEEMCRDNPWAVDWGCISGNRGFWLRLAERDLRPLLESFFYREKP